MSYFKAMRMHLTAVWMRTNTIRSVSFTGTNYLPWLQYFSIWLPIWLYFPFKTYPLWLYSQPEVLLFVIWLLYSTDAVAADAHWYLFYCTRLHGNHYYYYFYVSTGKRSGRENEWKTMKTTGKKEKNMYFCSALRSNNCLFDTQQRIAKTRWRVLRIRFWLKIQWSSLSFTIQFCISVLHSVEIFVLCGWSFRRALLVLHFHGRQCAVFHNKSFSDGSNYKTFQTILL